MTRLLLALLSVFVVTISLASNDKRIQQYLQQHPVTQQQLTHITNNKLKQWLAKHEQLMRQLPPDPKTYHLSLNRFKQQEQHFHVNEKLIKTTA